MVLLWVEEKQKKLEDKKVGLRIKQHQKEEAYHQVLLLQNQLEDQVEEVLDKLDSIPFNDG